VRKERQNATDKPAYEVELRPEDSLYLVRPTVTAVVERRIAPKQTVSAARGG
jgi:hypothetical protein